MPLYTYINKPNTLSEDGILAPAAAPAKRVIRNYRERAERFFEGKKRKITKQDVLEYLESWFPGRSRAISVLTEPIPDSAPERLREFRDQSELAVLPDYSVLQRLGLAESAYEALPKGKNRPVDDLDYSPINWNRANNQNKLRFKGIRHYFVVTPDGRLKIAKIPQK